ncbi:MAG TPA: hypothetical protein VFZ03_04555, partial [Dongiaceae bacterium]
MTTISLPSLTSARMLGLAAGAVVAAGLAVLAANPPLLSPATIMQASTTRPTAHIISSDALPHVAGKNITTMVVEFPPGGFSPPH